MSVAHSQDYMGDWILDHASFNNGTLAKASGYFKFLSDEIYEAEFSDGSNYGWTEAKYTMSGATLISAIDGQNLVLNGMSIVSDATGRIYFTDINCGLTAFDNYVGPAIGDGQPGITVSEDILTLTSSDGKAVMKYTPAFSSAFSATPISGPPPLTVTFTDESNGELESWEWDFGDGTSSTDQHPSHIYDVAGVYSVSLTVVDTADQTVTKTRPDYITVENTTGVQIENENRVFSIYPNPTSQSFLLVFHPETASEVELTAYNSLGQKVKILYEGSLSEETGNLTVDISDLKVGLYYIELSGKTFNTTQKLIISR